MLEYKLSINKYYIVTGCDKNAVSVEIPAEYNGLPVKELDKKTFYDCNLLKSLTILADLWIKEGTFQRSSLEEITIGNGVNVADKSFLNCTQLKKVNFLGTIDEWTERGIGKSFQHWYDLYLNDELVTDIVLNTVTIPACAFQNCTSLRKVTLSNTVKRLGNKAFKYCKNLTSLAILCNVEIGEEDFYSCDVRNLTISNKFTSHLGYKVFHWSLNLKKVNFLGTIDEWAQRGFGKAFENGYDLYLNDELVTSAVLTTAKISNYAFYNCESLEKVTLSNSVESVGAETFTSCFKLAEITIGNKIASIEPQFISCKNLKKVNFLGTIDEWAQRGLGKAFEHGYDLYLNDELVTSATILTFKISKYAFYNCSSLKSVTLAYGLDVLDDEVFKNCCNLVDVNLPDTLKRISPSALLGCDKLNYAKYHNGCYLGNENNKYLMLVKADNKDINYSIINHATKFINESAFLDCKRLESVGVEENSQLIDIGNFAFSGCINLKTANFEPAEQLTDIGFRVFKDCGLTSFSIPEGIKKINAWAFEKCSKVTRLKIPTSLQVIEAGTFYDCDLDEVDFVNYRGWQVEIPKKDGKIKIKKINKKRLMDKVKASEVLTEYSHVKWVNTLDLSKMKKF